MSSALNFSAEANQIAEVTSDELEREWQTYIKTIDFNELKQEIIALVQELRVNVAYFNSQYGKKNISGGLAPEQYKEKLTQKIKLIYDIFFKLQNAINAYERQRVVISYVHKDEHGERKILLFDNTVEALQAQNVSYGNYNFSKISYVLPQHFQILKNTLPDETNKHLQETTKIVEQRYREQKQVVSWITRGNKVAGYKFTNRGPINEAFAQFFLHTQPGIDYFRHDTERNVQTFVMHDTYGARRADSLNGFLVGDASKGNIQYAVKGEYGSPQGYSQVLKLLDRINDTTTHDDLRKILQDFRRITEDKARPLIKQASETTLNKIAIQLQQKVK